jgi:integrase
MAGFRRKILRGDRSEATRRRYDVTLGTFTEFLTSRGITRLMDISRSLVEEYKAQRTDQILTRKHSRGGSGLHLDIAILHAVFEFAIGDDLLVGRDNPVKFDKYPGKAPQSGVQPFKTDELTRLRQSAGPDLLAFLLLRHTGLRGFDASDLRWAEVDLRERVLTRRTHKRGKLVRIPIHPELHFVLEAELSLRPPAPAEHVLLNPETGRPMTRQRLYRRLIALGKRAGVERTHLHRFRDTLVIDLLLKGATVYDASKFIGNTVAVVEQRYSPYVKEPRERSRWIIEGPDGMETVGADSTKVAHPTQLKALVH